MTEQMRVYSYVVAHDAGFAPNPFHGVCSLACCKPKIRSQAKVGDIVVGLTTRSERVVYAMRVGEVISFASYWADARFVAKRPRRMARAAVDRCGDNIYEPTPEGDFLQLPSAHSNPDGTTNHALMRRDLSSLHVLVGKRFAYFGGGGPPLPTELRFLRATRGHRSRFTTEQVTVVARWFEELPRGVLAAPGMWPRKDDSWRQASSS